jgi:actin-related protein 5
MLQNLIIIGGNSRIKGFDERILSEIRMLNQQDIKINVVNQYAPEERQISPWLGAAKFARTWNDQDISSLTITKQEYEECGPGYLKEHRLSNRT